MSYDPAKVDRLAATCGDEGLFKDYKSLIAFSPKMFSSIVATALAALTLFDDPNIASVTSADSLDLRKFRQQKVAIFIQNRISDIGYTAPLVNILLDQLFAFTMATLPKPTDRSSQYIFWMKPDQSMCRHYQLSWRIFENMKPELYCCVNRSINLNISTADTMPQAYKRIVLPECSLPANHWPPVKNWKPC